MDWFLYDISLRHERVNENLLAAVVRSCSAKKVILKFHKIYSKKPVPAACNFI